MSGIKTSETQEERDARECEADMMTALSRLFGEAYMRGRAQWRNDARREEVRRGAGLTSSGGFTPGQTAFEAWPETQKFDGPWSELNATQQAEWETIAAAVIDKHGREQAPTNPAVVDEGLVERLADAYERGTERGAKPTSDGITAVLSELAKVPCDLPKVQEVEQVIKTGYEIKQYDAEETADMVLELFVSRMAPFLAARSARITAIEKRHAELLAAAQVALEHWGSDDAEHEAAAMTELQRLVDDVA